MMARWAYTITSSFPYTSAVVSLSWMGEWNAPAHVPDGADVTCVCGRLFHVDGAFICFVRCPTCGHVYSLTDQDGAT
jgi:hypothetical protein